MTLSAAHAAREIREGRLTSEELVQACLERIRALEPKVQAWQFLDEEHALAQARALRRAQALGRADRAAARRAGRDEGHHRHRRHADRERHGAAQGRTPREDAAVVKMLRAAGAVILGKTVTTECAYFNPGKTRNPHNPEHTPGGSSSGSAAAVAPAWCRSRSAARPRAR